MVSYDYDKVMALLNSQIKGKRREMNLLMKSWMIQTRELIIWVNSIRMWISLLCFNFTFFYWNLTVWKVEKKFITLTKHQQRLILHHSCGDLWSSWTWIWLYT